MTGQFRPTPVFQLRKDPKHPNGSRHTGTNCNAAVGATLVAFVTCGARRPSAAAVRELTGDTVGGTNNRQIAKAIADGFDVEVDIHDGSFSDVVDALRQGRAVSLSGSSAATKDIRAFCAQIGFDGNHQWALTDILDAPGEPTIVVYDPLADGRRGLALSPLLIPLSIVRKFAGLLDMRSQQEIDAHRPRKPLGLGRALYSTTDIVRCGVPGGGAHPSPPPAGPVRLRPNAALVHGQVGLSLTVGVPVGRIRRGPTTVSAIVGRKRRGMTFRAMQKINGQRVGSHGRLWFGDHDGVRWMHSSLFK